MILPYVLFLAIDLHQPARIPLHFEPNQGQVAGETEWIAKAPGATLYIKSTAIAFATTQDPGKKPRIMNFVGARQVKGEGVDPSGGYSNYFTGRDEKNWRGGIPHCAKIRYKNLYKGIDLVYYATPDRQIEYDLEAQPGADLDQLELSFSGFDKIAIDTQGDLILRSGTRVIKQHRPKVLRGKNEIACSYRTLPGNRVKLNLASHDEALPITIDPVLDFSTYLGGPGRDSLNGIALDPAGNIFVSGYSETPASPGLNPFQQTTTVVGAAFVAKFTPDGNKLLFFSALRSSGWSQASGLGVDATGSPTLIGTTASPDFPLKNAFQKTITSAQSAGFVARFASDGRTIVYSSYYGGSGVDNLFDGTLDESGAMIFSGNTTSRDIPIVNAFQPKYGGGQGDCFLAKVDATGALVFSTYFGGSETDYCYGGLALDSSGRILIEGSSYSDDLPLKNAIQTARSPAGGLPTAFAARFSSDGSSIDYATFLGGAGAATLSAAAINSKGEIYLAGAAYGGQFSTTNAFQSTCVSQICGLLVKLDPTGQQILNSTFLAGSGWSSVQSIAIGSDDSVYLLGETSSSDFPTLNTLFSFVGGGGYDQDVFAAKFLGDLRTLVYSTFLGGDDDDFVGGMALDAQNRLYAVGWTFSDNFPVKNAFQSTYGGDGDGFLLRISDPTVIAVSPLTANPGQLQFRHVQGGPPIANQTIQVAGAGVPFTVSSNAAWVTVNPQAATAPANLSIGAGQLAPGNYTAVITVTPSSGTPLTIPVALTILNPAPQLISVSPAFIPLLSDDTTVTFTGSGFTPQTQLLISGTVTWGYPVVYVDPQTIQTTMSYLSFISPGSYQFSAVNPQSDISKAVTVSVGGETPVVTNVVNAASHLSGPLAPGELIQVNGSNFGPSGQLAVTLGGIGATVLSSSNTQALVLTPTQLTGATADIILSTSGLSSIPLTLPVAPTAPGLFTVDGSGKGLALIQGTATLGSTITLFGTGVADLTQPFTATINGANAPVGSVTSVPNQPGQFQLTLTIPQIVPSPRPKSSPATVVISVGGRSTQPGVTLAINQAVQQ